MTNYITKALLLKLLTLWIGVFGVTSSYALTFIEAQKLLASDGAAENFFSNSVSISGDTAVIGASDFRGNGLGSAYVLERDSAGVWYEQQKLTASDGEVRDEFGFSVSISGDTAVIGAYLDDDNVENSGSAYVFVRDGTGLWSEKQKLTASDGEANDGFGYSVLIFGDTALVGAYADDDNGNASGATYVYVRDGSGMWNEKQKLTASDGVEFGKFGFSVSTSGDTVVIGAIGDDDNGSESGSAYVFVRDGTGLWSEQQKLTASDGAEFDNFGFSVSILDNTAMIGAYLDDDNGERSGSVYMFSRDSTGLWSEQQKLTASDGTTFDHFGISVSISGDTAVIGAFLDISGSAYVFVRDGTGVWREQQKLTPSDGEVSDRFGTSVFISGDTAVIGAPFDDDKGSRSGSAYVFEADDPGNDLITIEKLINHRVRETSDSDAQLLAGTRYRAEYKVTNNSPDRLYRVQVFEGGQLVCNLYALDPGESTQGCANNHTVLVGSYNLPASATAKVAGSSQTLAGQTNAYYTGLTNMPGELNVTHYVNDNNADTQATAVTVNDSQAHVLFRVENTGSIELYRIKTYHDPASPINSGWQEQCFIGTLMPGQVHYCKRTISVTRPELNKAFGRVQGEDANVNPIGYVNASNPTYFNVVLP